jgi:hypothetical protein
VIGAALVPRLDSAGNSVSGQLAARELSRRLVLDDAAAELEGDDAFWRSQAQSPAIFVTPESLTTDVELLSVTGKAPCLGGRTRPLGSACDQRDGELGGLGSGDPVAPSE